MQLFIQLTLSGLTNGAVYALVALGLVLIFKSTDVINFAQGEFLLVGAYVAFMTIGQWGLPWPIGVVITLLIGVAIAVAVERFILRRMIGEPIISVIMVTIGLSSIMHAVILGIWGPDPQSFPSFLPSSPLNIFGATVGADRLWALIVAIVLLGAFTVFFQRSGVGIALRAVADDQQAAMSMGIPIRRIFAVAWSIAAITAGIAGIIAANILGVSGDVANLGLRVFPVVILGGLDSLPGAIVGGIIIGLLEQYAGAYTPPVLGLSSVIPFVALIVILMVRPYGLFGQRRIERV
ncbi:MAG TPA: branched-chain amino acid ABC transporter permease [Aggregatilineales bacterium]|nr:branched-chain amino acid ABC transporter permease [Aggregatilineales bacterium]